jgi:D-methionine transport system permease protein
MSFSNPLFLAIWQTLYMVFASSFLAIFFGLCVGVLLWLTGSKGFLRQRLLHQGLGIIVNAIRSVPYIILLVALIPFTRLLMGTSIGTSAAIVSLTIAAIPFYGRMVESAIENVPVGLIEAGLSMGGTVPQILLRIILPEAAPNLIKGAMQTVIGLIGYSAMAGAVGGGGLGQLAIDYGYERFDVGVMVETVILLMAFVQGVQWLGEWASKHWRQGLLYSLIFSAIAWCAILAFSFWPTTSSNEVIRVGVTSGPIADVVMKAAQKFAWEHEHIDLKIVTFDDYALPNAALNEGEIDANIFQHQPFLDAETQAHHYDLVTIGKTFVYPMGFYSTKIHHIQELKEGALIAVQSDPTNEGRALLILQSANLIHLKTGLSPLGSVHDIDQNPHHFIFKTLDAAQLPRALEDADLVAVNNDFAQSAHLTLKDALLKEDKDSPYANIIVVQKRREKDPFVDRLIEIMHSSPVVDATMSVFPDGQAVPAWSSGNNSNKIDNSNIDSDN